MTNLKDKIETLKTQVKGFSAEQIIKFANEQFSGRLSFASSLGEEDQVITDMISKVAPKIEVFTLDTGRLFQETYDLIGFLDDGKKRARGPQVGVGRIQRCREIDDAFRHHRADMRASVVGKREKLHGCFLRCF